MVVSDLQGPDPPEVEIFPRPSDVEPLLQVNVIGRRMKELTLVVAVRAHINLGISHLQEGVVPLYGAAEFKGRRVPGARFLPLLGRLVSAWPSGSVEIGKFLLLFFVDGLCEMVGEGNYGASLCSDHFWWPYEKCSILGFIKRGSFCVVNWRREDLSLSRKLQQVLVTI